MNSAPAAQNLSQTVIAILGRRDQPTDGVRDYCSWLSQALRRRGVTFETTEVDWATCGWVRALRDLGEKSRDWPGRWVFFQYTALSWSRHGFPFGALAALWLLRRRRTRCAVVFHDSSESAGKGLLGRIRAVCQRWVMRAAYHLADWRVFTVPLECVPWLPGDLTRAVFIPIGSNIPGRLSPRQANGRCADGKKTVAVFGVTGSGQAEREVADIAYTLSRVQQQVAGVRLIVLGRGSEDARDSLERALNGSGLEVAILGLLPAERVTQALSAADALLFVRGHVSPQRGSAIAGIACGLPIVGYGEPSNSFPIAEAGVQLVPAGDRDALAGALCQVLTDDALWNQLHERSQRVFTSHFSWDAIAGRYIAVLIDG
jgi:glycosyltransferase involved in cell wall biosynthesis